MGTSFSTYGANSLSREQQDIQHLGSRYPFGDGELWKLYRIFHEKRDRLPEVSFLSEWAAACTILKPDEPRGEDPTEDLKRLREEKLMLMQVVENKILPPDFGRKLETAAFSLSEDDGGIGGGVGASTVSETDQQRLQRVEETRLARLEKFFDGASNVGRRGGRKALGVLFDCCVVQKNGHGQPGEENLAPAKDLLELGYRLTLASEFLEAASKDEPMGGWIPPEKANQASLEALGKSLLDFVRKKRSRFNYGGTPPSDSAALDEGLVTKIDFQEWSESVTPVLPSSLATLMHHIFFPEKPYPPSRTPFSFPKLDSDSVFFAEPTSPLLFSFSCMSKSLGGTVRFVVTMETGCLLSLSESCVCVCSVVDASMQWHRLYTSASDGLSFNRLQNALLGYGGPTLMVVQATNGGMFGAFTASAWKESKDFYGNSDCFLYQLLPMTEVYRPSGNATNYMYCNSEARSKGYDGKAHGLGFGGTTDRPRLYIAESLDGCLAGSQDLTFESGPLLPRTADGGLQKKFDVESLEVWGVGGADVVAAALGARNRQREIQAANIRKARKVDKAAFLDDFRSGLIESKAFKHRSEMQGRADVDVDERHQKTFAYAK